MAKLTQNTKPVSATSTKSAPVKKTGAVPPRKTSAEKQQQAPIPSGILLTQVAAMPVRYRTFLSSGIAYHVKAGRLEATKEGFKCSKDGAAWFSAGGRSAEPEDVSRMRVSLTTGADFVSHKGETTKVEKAPTGSKFPYMIPDRNLVAGRIDSQAQFACLML